MNTENLSEKLTHLLITSTELEDVLLQMYRFFQTHLSMDHMVIWKCNAKSGIIHYKISVIDGQVIYLDEKVKFNPEAYDQMLISLTRKIEIQQYPTDDPMVKQLCKHFKIEDHRYIIRAVFKSNENNYNGLSLESLGERQDKGRVFRQVENMYDAISGAARNILNQLDIIKKKDQLTLELEKVHKQLNQRIVGQKGGLKEVMKHVDQVAKLDNPVLLTGETGVGKEVIANAIHSRSMRRNRRLISFNCGAIPETLIESELFGYEKGAFTGATDKKFGYFEQADGGTLFMDEVGELSIKAQVKLLRFLQTMEFQRIGGEKPVLVNVRVIAATNRNLEAMVRESKFRDDLWYRLNVYPIHIPSLRERKVDIPDLAMFFAQMKTREINLPYEFSFAPQSIDQLQAYDWPGNVRELQNIIERSLILSNGEPLTFPDLVKTKSAENKTELIVDTDYFPTLDEVNVQYIRKALIISKGKISGPGGAAQLLGLNPSTLRGKMKKFEIKINKIPE